MKRQNPKRKPQPMSRRERGVWLDAEGTIVAAFPDHYHIASEQTKEGLEALQAYCQGARRDGVKCRVKPRGKYYRMEITGLENIAKEISLIEPSIRTTKKKQQIRHFKETLKIPRRARPKPARRAREILKL